VVKTGLEVLCSERLDLLRGRRVGVLCHPASVTSDLVHAVDRLLQTGVRITRLFGPEHGVRGEAQDMIGVDAEKDRRTGIPVSSLYGGSFESLSPAAADLADVDVLVIDLQDVGSRYYTYVWTMALAMQAAARAHVTVVVVDRPNPLGGAEVESGPLLPGFHSFVGLGAVAVRHGMTIGEIARMVKSGIPGDRTGRFGKPIDCELEVVGMKGWKRSMDYDATGLPWVMPSPNMPTPDTAFVYPGLCLVEGTNLSEGRGTTRPFEIVGAPFLDGYRLAAALDELRLPGVRFRPLSFLPMFQKFARRSCGGVQLHVTDRAAFRPYRTGIAFLLAAARQAPGEFQWRTEPYEFVAHPPAIDLLTGSDAVRRGIDGGATLDDITAAFAPFERRFEELRRPHLQYPLEHAAGG
jgi:uncharacterized protein YbbC (DUF1343 family)